MTYPKSTPSSARRPGRSALPRSPRTPARRTSRARSRARPTTPCAPPTSTPPPSPPRTAAPTREVYLDGVRIPAHRMVGAPGDGFRLALRTLDHTRVTIAAQAVGSAQGPLDVATGYVRERRQFGRPVAEFQGIQFMVAD